jgi:hypothetical protein
VLVPHRSATSKLDDSWRFMRDAWAFMRVLNAGDTADSVQLVSTTENQYAHNVGSCGLTSVTASS